MSKPSILLITGSFALPEFYDSIVDPVAAKGYEIKALHLPSVGLKTGPREGVPPTMYDDAAFIAQEAKRLADDGKDVILIAHSYGGVPMTESTKGLGKIERQKEGKTGGIVKLAYITVLLPPVGVSGGSLLADVENKVGMEVDDKGWLYHPDIPRSASLTFSDLPKEEGETWQRRFSRHSAISFAGELTHAGYKDIPVSYLLCEDDLVIPLKNQRDGIELVVKESGKKVDVTSIKAGHCPMASQPQKVVDWILNLA